MNTPQTDSQPEADTRDTPVIAPESPVLRPSPSRGSGQRTEPFSLPAGYVRTALIRYHRKGRSPLVLMRFSGGGPPRFYQWAYPSGELEQIEQDAFTSLATAALA